MSEQRPDRLETSKNRPSPMLRIANLDRAFAGLDYMPTLASQKQQGETSTGRSSKSIKRNILLRVRLGCTVMDYDFQFNYVLSGWIDLVIEGIEGTLTFKEGDTYFLSHKILHNETRVSDDFSVLQIYGPAEAGTEQLTPEID